MMINNFFLQAVVTTKATITMEAAVAPTTRATITTEANESHETLSDNLTRFNAIYFDYLFIYLFCIAISKFGVGATLFNLFIFI